MFIAKKFDSYDRCNIENWNVKVLLKHFLYVQVFQSFKNSQYLFCIFILSTSFLQNYFVTFRLQHLYKTRSHCAHISVGSPWLSFITISKSIAVVGEVRGQTVTGFQFLVFHHSVQIHRVQGGAGGAGGQAAPHPGGEAGQAGGQPGQQRVSGESGQTEQQPDRSGESVF